MNEGGAAILRIRELYNSCGECRRFLDEAGDPLIGAAASVGIEHNLDTMEAIKVWLEQKHRGHRQE